MQPLQYTGPDLLAQLLGDALAEYHANPCRIRALRLVCEVHECLLVAADHVTFDPTPHVFSGVFDDDGAPFVAPDRKRLDPAFRRDVCVIDRPQYFVNLAEFLRAPGDLVVLVCQPDHCDTHPELDLSSIMRRDLRPMLPRVRMPKLY